MAQIMEDRLNAKKSNLVINTLKLRRRRLRRKKWARSTMDVIVENSDEESDGMQNVYDVLEEVCNVKGLIDKFDPDHGESTPSDSLSSSTDEEWHQEMVEK